MTKPEESDRRDRLEALCERRKDLLGGEDLELAHLAGGDLGEAAGGEGRHADIEPVGVEPHRHIELEPGGDRHARRRRRGERHRAVGQVDLDEYRLLAIGVCINVKRPNLVTRREMPPTHPRLGPRFALIKKIDLTRSKAFKISQRLAHHQAKLC